MEDETAEERMDESQEDDHAPKLNKGMAEVIALLRSTDKTINLDDYIADFRKEGEFCRREDEYWAKRVAERNRKSNDSA